MIQTSRRMKVIAWATVALYVLVAVCLTHMPKIPSELEGYKDKHLHAVGYFMYAALIYIAMGLTFPRLRGVPLMVVLLLAAWAAADEITQPYFGRDCDFYDWLADMTGAIAAVILLGTLRLIAAFRARRERLAAPQA